MLHENPAKLLRVEEPLRKYWTKDGYVKAAKAKNKRDRPLGVDAEYA